MARRDSTAHNTTIDNSNKLANMIQTQLQKKNGFTLLYTVVIVSLILSITAGISNIVFKQMILSSLASDSQIAFYQADTAVECGLYFLQNPNSNFYFENPPSAMSCGTAQQYIYNQSKSSAEVVFYDPYDTTIAAPCASLIFDKTVAGQTSIEGRGFNVCNPQNPRYVERVLQVTF